MFTSYWISSTPNRIFGVRVFVFTFERWTLWKMDCELWMLKVKLHKINTGAASLCRNFSKLFLRFNQKQTFFPFLSLSTMKMMNEQINSILFMENLRRRCQCCAVACDFPICLDCLHACGSLQWFRYSNTIAYCLFYQLNTRKCYYSISMFSKFDISFVLNFQDKYICWFGLMIQTMFSFQESAVDQTFKSYFTLINN